MLAWIVVTFILTVAFTFVNGFHDGANSIATMVSTRVLTPRQAVVWRRFGISWPRSRSGQRGMTSAPGSCMRNRSPCR